LYTGDEVKDGGGNPIPSNEFCNSDSFDVEQGPMWIYIHKEK